MYSPTQGQAKCELRIGHHVAMARRARLALGGDMLHVSLAVCSLQQPALLAGGVEVVGLGAGGAALAVAILCSHKPQPTMVEV